MRPALQEVKRILGNKKDIVGVEIGVLRGENAREIMSEYSEIKHLYLVDSYKNSYSEYTKALEILRQWENKLVWCIDDSVNASKDFEDNFFDFVYIDGDHSYDGVKRDIYAYWPKVKKGGAISGHDYNPRWESMKGIIKAVDEFVAENKLELWTATTGSSSDWVIKKI